MHTLKTEYTSGTPHSLVPRLPRFRTRLQTTYIRCYSASTQQAHHIRTHQLPHWLNLWTSDSIHNIPHAHAHTQFESSPRGTHVTKATDTETQSLSAHLLSPPTSPKALFSWPHSTEKNANKEEWMVPLAGAHRIREMRLPWFSLPLYSLDTPNHFFNLLLW